METDPGVGGCGGLNDARVAAPAPDWFERYRWSFAVGPQGRFPDAEDNDAPSLWGAGLTVRASAWRTIVQRGFQPRLSDRAGVALSGAGDTEICLALRLAGWRLRYEPRLRLTHFLPDQRLQWPYLRRLHRAFGASAPLLDPYWAALDEGPMAASPPRTQRWSWQALVVVRWLLAHPAATLRFHGGEGDAVMLQREGQLGKLGCLLRLLSRYNASFAAVRLASWRARAGAAE
jgi:hypothetical protein